MSSTSSILMNRLMQPHLRPRSTHTGRGRRHYTLADKLAIVRESQQPGVSQASISRKHKLGKNVLWTWRKSFDSLAGFPADSRESGANGCEHEVLNLRQQIAELERLLGQKAFEIELLRGRLQSGMRGISNLDMTTKGSQ